MYEYIRKFIMSPFDSSSKYPNSIDGYELFEQPLGTGGFASVYRAQCKRTGHHVAIKKIDIEKMKKYNMVDRVREEVQIHSQLEHHAILQLYTFFEDNMYVYLVLELCHNGELVKYLKQKGNRLSEIEACFILKQVVEGLIYLHNNNIVHRDITLSNVLLTKDMRVKIADFGLATQLKCNVQQTTMCGTPNFISPEVATRSSHGLKTDIWGLGCLLYTLLVGHPPFDTNAIKSTLTKVVMSDVVMPHYLSNKAKDLISRLLKKNPRDRIELFAILNHDFMKQKKKCNEPSIWIKQSCFTNDSGFKSSSQLNENTCTTRNSNLNVLSCSQDFCFNNKINKQDSCSSNILKSFHTYSNSNCQNNFHSAPFQHSENKIVTRFDDQNSFKTFPGTSSSNSRMAYRFCTQRLQKHRHKTKTKVLSILNNGWVCVEFIKIKLKSNEERVVEVVQISPDSENIVIYKPNKDRGVALLEEPPPIPNGKADEIYSYETLPEHHWKKYAYAAQFVKLIASKTAKVVFYSDAAKCLLMEDGQTFEVHFYNGSQVSCLGNGIIKIVTNSESKSFSGPECLDKSERGIYDQFKKYHDHCCKVEKTLLDLAASSNSEMTVFPVTLGRRPTKEKSDTPTNCSMKNSYVINSNEVCMTHKNGSQVKLNLETREVKCKTAQGVERVYDERDKHLLPDWAKGCLKEIPHLIVPSERTTGNQNWQNR